MVGLTAANDVSARKWQSAKRGGGQWDFSKGFDTFCPLGPTLLRYQPPSSDSSDRGDDGVNTVALPIASRLLRGSHRTNSSSATTTTTTTDADATATYDTTTDTDATSSPATSSPPPPPSSTMFEPMQRSNTRDMIFTVPELICFLSRGRTLLPGTVILTGTPEGVGFQRRPPVYLQHGDHIEIDIHPIGKLRNPVRFE